MSKAKLKKILAGMDKDEIIEMVGELYDARKDAKAYLEYWIDPDIDKETEKTRTAVNNVYFLPSGKARGKGPVSEVRRILKDYSSMVFEPERSMELGIYALERRIEWIATRSGADRYEDAMRKLFAELSIEVGKSGMEERFGLRMNRLGERIDEVFRIAEEKHHSRRRRWFRW